MQVEGILKKVRSGKSSFQNERIVTVFEVPNIGEVSRTFNIRSQFPERSLFYKTFNSSISNQDDSIFKIGNPYMRAVAFEEALIGRGFRLLLEETGKNKYPFNIIEIDPLT